MARGTKDANSGNKMKLLGVETSSPIFSVAVSDGPKILAYLQVDGQGRPSSLLTDLIEQALKEAGVALPELNGLAISIGPGSFTGLRIGVMTVKTLAWALKKPVLPVSSLEVVAQNMPLDVPNIYPFLDARRGNVYTARFCRDGGGTLRRAGPDELLHPEEALRKVEPPAHLVGDGLKRYAELVDSLSLREVQQAPASLWVPRADRACRIASAAWPAGIVDDPHPLVPQYLYSKEGGITAR